MNGHTPRNQSTQYDQLQLVSKEGLVFELFIKINSIKSHYG
jgi:hypothetical protein